MPARSALFAVALGLLLGTGCGAPKLNESRTWSMTASDINGLDLPAIAKEQKLTVEYTSSGGEVTALVMKEDDARGESGLHSADEKKALGKHRGKSGEFSVDVPANTAVRVIVTGVGSKTEVTLKVTNQK